MTKLALLAALALVLAVAGCGGDDEGAGGAADLPGPVPEGVEFATPPASAPDAPDFSAELVDGTALTASELWAERPVVLVFTASFCDRCRTIDRDVAAAVAEHDGAIAVLDVVEADDAEAAAYAEELDLGHPVARAADRVWLSYAAREPGLVTLVSKGGKVLRGWPNGISRAELAPYLDDLVE